MSNSIPPKMANRIQIVPDKVQVFIKTIRRHFLKWSVQRPILSMILVIFASVALLPIVTAATLMPIALLLRYTGLLASQGIFYLTYNILIQGLLLATIIVALFIASFAVATSASVLHSYKVFKTSVTMKKNQ